MKYLRNQISLRSWFFIVLLSMQFFSHARARIADISIIAVLNDPELAISAEHENLSVILAAIALQADLFYNYRFFGPYAPHFDDSKNEYQPIFDGKSNATDPLWRLTKYFFPSSSGTALNPLVNDSPYYIGRYLHNRADKGAFVVATLLAFVERLRHKPAQFIHEISLDKYGKAQLIQAVDNLEKTGNKPTFIAKLKDNAELRNILTHHQVDHETFFACLGKPQKMRSEDEQKQIALLKKKKILLPKDMAIQQFYASLLKEQRKSHISDDKSATLLMEKLTEKLSEIIFKDFDFKEKNWEPSTTKQAVLKILQAIRDSLKGEQEGLYPRYTTEQLILTFFLEMYNTKEDLVLLQATMKKMMPYAFSGKLDNRTNSSNSSSPKKSPILSGYELLKLSKKSPYLPYKINEILLENTSAQAYDRINDTLLTDKTFPDCIEAVLMHLAILLTYDYNVEDFILDSWQADLGNSKQLWSRIDKFFAVLKEKPEYVNNGSRAHRSMWNAVVGDQNKLSLKTKIPEILYQDTTRGSQNNTMSGFINFTSALLRITNTDPEIVSSKNIRYDTTASQNIWIVNNLKKVFQKIGRPHRSYTIKFNRDENATSSQEPLGVISIVVNESEQYLFSFEIIMTKTHGRMANLSQKIILSSNAKSPKELHNHAGSAFAVLNYLLKANTDESALNQYHHFHQLFLVPMKDDRQKGKAMKKVAQYPQNDVTRSFIDNIIYKASWHDPHWLITMLNEAPEQYVDTLAEAITRAQNGRPLRIYMENHWIESSLLNKTLLMLASTKSNIHEFQFSITGHIATKHVMVERICKALPNIKSLHTLNFDNALLNEFNGNNQSMNTLEQCLMANQTITTLNLSWNNINNFGASYLASMLEKNSTLQTLDLSDNQFIEQRGLIALAQALKKNTTLKKLVLTKNNHVYNYLGTFKRYLDENPSSAIEQIILTKPKTDGERNKINMQKINDARFIWQE